VREVQRNAQFMLFARAVENTIFLPWGIAISIMTENQSVLSAPAQAQRQHQRSVPREVARSAEDGVVLTAGGAPRCVLIVDRAANARLGALLPPQIVLMWRDRDANEN